MIDSVLLKIQGLSKTFPGVKALSRIDFDLRVGEIHCLVGENGAGKSTFIRILSGAILPDQGTIELFGKTFSFLNPATSIDLGIQTVYQESVLVGTMNVAENIYLGHEHLSDRGLFDRKGTLEAARKLIDTFRIRIDPLTMVEDLSTAERQIVGIIKALSRDAKILILDEPTASLSSSEKTMLLDLLRDIAGRGVGILYISHHLEEVFEIADRITVFKDGRKVGTHPGKGVAQGELIREMVGRSADLFYTREEIDPDRERRNLEIIEYCRGDVVKNISFTVRSGEIFGIGGMVGSGRTELVRLLFGFDQRDSGSIRLDGVDITPNSPQEAIGRGVCLITEDRQKTGLILVRSIRENVSLARLNVGKRPLLNLTEEKKSVEAMVNSLRVVTPGIEQEVINLSGGNQQKVVLAKWLMTDARVFIFDEPTRGIDIGAKEEIYRLMTNLAKENCYIIMVSSDMPELLAMSDRIGVMREGRMVNVFDRDEATEENILSYSIGVECR